MITFKNSYLTLPESFYKHSLPSASSTPKFFCWNDNLAKSFDLNQNLDIFSGSDVSKDTTVALSYCGHQFGHFNPYMGDGRAHMLGQLSSNNVPFDFQLKGSGATPFSKRGDGLGQIGQAMREYLVSEYMHYYGIPTTRSLCIVDTGNHIIRQDEQPGAILTRVALGHLRIGSFEYFFSRDQKSSLRKLADYSIDRHYKNIVKEGDYISLFKEICFSSISLVSSWMGVGFIHGVMNTDNTSICGLTLDYGPCAFMDHYESDKVYSSIDRNGRYAYNNQLTILQWNLSVLANALSPLLLESYSSLDSFRDEMIDFFKIIDEKCTSAYYDVFSNKLGVESNISNRSFIDSFLSYLEDNQLDFTNSFRKIGETLKDNSELYNSWKKLLIANEDELLKVNPSFTPRNHIVERAIDNYVLNKDRALFDELCELFKSPFKDTNHAITVSPKKDEVVQFTFCGT